ncbi:hypothetical protein ABIB08_009065 [Bradyrhizobium sp. RT11b]
MGKDAAGLSASAIGRLKDGWLDEHAAWQKRDLSAKRYVLYKAEVIHRRGPRAQLRGCRVRDAGMSRLVQQPAAPGGYRQ